MTVYNLFIITTNMQRGVLWKKSSKTFKQSPWKIPTKKFIFSKGAGSKNEFIHSYYWMLLLKL